MTYEEKKKYWNPVRDRYFRDKCGNLVRASYALEAFLGTDERTKYNNESAPMAENVKQLLQALAGPHGETIYKAMCVRKGVAP